MKLLCLINVTVGEASQIQTNVIRFNAKCLKQKQKTKHILKEYELGTAVRVVVYRYTLL